MTYDAFSPASGQDHAAPGAASANTTARANTWIGASGGFDGTANGGGYGSQRGQRGQNGHDGMTGGGTRAAAGAMPAGASPAGISPSAAGAAANQNSSTNSGPNFGQDLTQNSALNSTLTGNDATGQELLNRQIEQHMRQQDAARHEQWQKQVNQWREEVAQEPQLGGVHMAANVARAQLALDRFDQGRHIGRLLEESGYGNHPEVLRFFNKVADALMEDSLVRGEPGGGMPPLEERMYAGWSSRK